MMLDASATFFYHHNCLFPDRSTYCQKLSSHVTGKEKLTIFFFYHLKLVTLKVFGSYENKQSNEG